MTIINNKHNWEYVHQSLSQEVVASKIETNRNRCNRCNPKTRKSDGYEEILMKYEEIPSLWMANLSHLLIWFWAPASWQLDVAQKISPFPSSLSCSSFCPNKCEDCHRKQIETAPNWSLFPTRRSWKWPLDALGGAAEPWDPMRPKSPHRSKCNEPIQAIQPLFFECQPSQPSQ